MPPLSSPPPPYLVSLAPDDARNLATSGATLLLLDVPLGTIVGIDHRSFIAGPNFKGVKMIPVVIQGKGNGNGGGGAHFVATNASGSSKSENRGNTSVGPTSFFFFHAREPGSVTVRRWSTEHEVLIPLEDEDEIERYAEGVKRFDFDGGLAPYDSGSLALWQSLTRFISRRTTARIAPSESSKAVAMSVVAEAEEVEKRRNGRGMAARVPTEAERKLDEQLERGRRKAASSAASPSSNAAEAAVVIPDVVSAPRYVELPRHAVVASGGGSERSVGGGYEKQSVASSSLPPLPPPSSSSSLLTAANLDKTSTLQAVVCSHPFNGDASELLGEFQHAFVSFWAGHSLLAFVAWRDCLRLVLGCEAGVCLPFPEKVEGGGERDQKEDKATMKVDGAFFRDFVDALAAQLAVATTTTKPGSSSSSASASAASASASAASASASAATSSLATTSNSLVDDLLEDSFLKKAARRFLENVREASEEGGVDFVVAVDKDDGETQPKKIRLSPPSPELQESCARLSRVLEEGLGWGGLGKPRVKEPRRFGGKGGVGGESGDGSDDGSDDDSDGPVVVMDVEKGY